MFFKIITLFFIFSFKTFSFRQKYIFINNVQPYMHIKRRNQYVNNKKLNFNMI